MSTTTNEAHELLDTVQAASYLHRSARAMERDRVVGGGCRFLKAGFKVLYRRSDLDKWLDSRAFASTSEARLAGVV